MIFLDSIYPALPFFFVLYLLYPLLTRSRVHVSSCCTHPARVRHIKASLPTTLATVSVSSCGSFGHRSVTNCSHTDLEPLANVVCRLKFFTQHHKHVVHRSPQAHCAPEESDHQLVGGQLELCHSLRQPSSITLEHVLVFAGIRGPGGEEHKDGRYLWQRVRAPRLHNQADS